MTEGDRAREGCRLIAATIIRAAMELAPGEPEALERAIDKARRAIAPWLQRVFDEEIEDLIDKALEALAAEFPNGES